MGEWLDSGSRHVVFGRGAEARGHIAPPNDLQERQPDPEPQEHRRGGDTEAHHELLAGTVTINGVADDDEDSRIAAYTTGRKTIFLRGENPAVQGGSESDNSCPCRWQSAEAPR